MSDLWTNVKNLTDLSKNGYFGHEIQDILGLVTSLLERVDSDLNGTSNLALNIDSTQSGTMVMNNVIGHHRQWEEIDQVQLVVDMSNTDTMKTIGMWTDRTAVLLRCCIW